MLEKLQADEDTVVAESANHALGQLDRS
jgi:hypothetical protein